MTKKIIITILAFVLVITISTLIHFGNNVIVTKLAMYQLEDSNGIRAAMTIAPIIKTALQLLAGYIAGSYVANMWGLTKKGNNVEK